MTNHGESQHLPAIIREGEHFHWSDVLHREFLYQNSLYKFVFSCIIIDIELQAAEITSGSIKKRFQFKSGS